MESITKNNNMVTTSQVLALGFSKQILNKYVKEGLLERIRQGVYILPDAEHDDMYAAIDLLTDKLDRQLKKHKEKTQSLLQGATGR